MARLVFIFSSYFRLIYYFSFLTHAPILQTLPSLAITLETITNNEYQERGKEMARLVYIFYLIFDLIIISVSHIANSPFLAITLETITNNIKQPDLVNGST